MPATEDNSGPGGDTQDPEINEMLAKIARLSPINRRVIYRWLQAIITASPEQRVEAERRVEGAMADAADSRRLREIVLGVLSDMELEDASPEGGKV